MKHFKLLLVVLFFMPAFSKAQDVFEIKWQSGTNIYQTAVIIYEDGYAKSRTKWRNEGDVSPKFVEQDITVKTGDDGMYLIGSNPVYPGTDERYTSYNADSFIIIEENGKIWGVQLDEGNNFGKCTVRKIVGDNYRKNSFLRTFDNWSLNN